MYGKWEHLWASSMHLFPFSCPKLLWSIFQVATSLRRALLIKNSNNKRTKTIQHAVSKLHGKRKATNSLAMRKGYGIHEMCMNLSSYDTVKAQCTPSTKTRRQQEEIEYAPKRHKSRTSGAELTPNWPHGTQFHDATSQKTTIYIEYSVKRW